MKMAELAERKENINQMVSYDRLEADDVLGILATMPSNRTRVIVSDDKDMASVPCHLYARGEMRVITEIMDYGRN